MRTKINEELKKSELKMRHLSETAGEIHLPLSTVAASLQDPIMHVSSSIKQSKLSPDVPELFSV